MCGGARRDPAGLGDDDTSAVIGEELCHHRRDESRLAATGRRGDDSDLLAGERRSKWIDERRGRQTRADGVDRGVVEGEGPSHGYRSFPAVNASSAPSARSQVLRTEA